ncbi:MAG: ankyrin repeat domain-containing protein [Phycisphaerales bacterium]|nr:MAG: ankyrin repeat domain-containing protein [Phycisphaerales bacterium]
MLANRWCTAVAVLALSVFNVFVARAQDGSSIHEAAGGGDLPTVTDILAGDSSSVNAKDDREQTPLHLAARFGHREVVAYLIAKGADVNAQTDKGRTPLHLASVSGHDETIEILIMSGADRGIQDGRGRTALSMAIARGYLHLASVLEAPIDRADLIADVRQLSDFIESVHPDPYINGGGKIAFHRRLQNTIGSVPQEGLTRMQFYRHLRPFVAAIGDAHTWLRDPYYSDDQHPGGIPLYFGIVEDSLWVSRAPRVYEHLIGARLVSVEGVPLSEIVTRQGQRMGAENEYLLLRNLARKGVLWRRCFLEHLLPEWTDRSKVRVRLRHRDGHIEEHVLPIPKVMPTSLVRPQSRLQLPSRQACDFVYEFLDEERKTALLVIDNMATYREVFERMRVSGLTLDMNRIRGLFTRYNPQQPPQDVDELIAGLPSATEVFRTLVEEMKEANTRSLLIDLRRNDGGSSAMYNFLLYMLYGEEVLLSAKTHLVQVRKLSEHCLGRYDGKSPADVLGEINGGRPFPLVENDYDFAEAGPPVGRDEPENLARIAREFRQEVAGTPTFERLYKTGKYDGYYSPQYVVVLCSPRTFSSGWTMMHYLFRAGALIVGTPSSQGPNCFGSLFPFTFTHSRLSGTVSHMRFEYFPNDTPEAQVLRPHYPLSYDKLAEYEFDPNAEILFALEVIEKLERADAGG